MQKKKPVVVTPESSDEDDSSDDSSEVGGFESYFSARLVCDRISARWRPNLLQPSTLLIEPH